GSFDVGVDAGRDGLSRLPAGPHVDPREASPPLPERVRRPALQRRHMSPRGLVPPADVAAAAAPVGGRHIAGRARGDVVITAGTDPAVAEALMNAVSHADARPSLLTIPRLPFQGRLADPYVPPSVEGSARGCSVWIDITFPYLAGARVCDEAVQNGGVRYLLGGDMGCAGLARLFGGVDLDRYYEVHKGFDEVTGTAVGRSVRITDGLGSDVSFVLAKPAFTKPRRCEEPGIYFVP